MTGPPTVTVAICLHNSSRYVAETIESVLAQTFRSFEILLVDDGSTDGCADRIQDRFGDGRLRIFRQARRGLGHARAVSVANARGEYVAFLDHDDLWLPHKLERQVGIAREQPDAGLIFSDCIFVDAEGRGLGRLSERHDYSRIDLSETRGFHELLVHGCFIDLSTVLAPAKALAEAGGFDPRYSYVEDYDLWLRVARTRRLVYVSAPLAKRRIHDGQFTWRHADIALAEQVDLLRPFAERPSCPPEVRGAVGDYLLGQHRECRHRLLRQRRFAAAAKATVGMLRFPGRLADSYRHRLSRTAAGPVAVGVERGARWAWEAARRVLRGRRPTGPVAGTTTEVWIDGSPLGGPQTGYFNLVVELIRAVTRWGDNGFAVHVVTPPAGRQALGERLPAEAKRLRVHEAALDLRRGAPIRPFRGADTVEVLVWRGRYRYAGSRKIALVQDLTTRIHPELHPPGTVLEFEEYLRYALRHADTIATISENSRRDIVERLGVFPESVHVIPSRPHPTFLATDYSRAIPASYHLAEPYILCVGTLEPRKNLRRLVRAFERLARDEEAREHLLVLAGPPGWDEGFPRFLLESEVYPRVRTLGFVPLEHLPSLYRFAAAVVYPSVYEGFGLPVLEAMCCSAVTVSARIASLPPPLVSGGIDFDPYSTEEMAAALVAALRMRSGEAAAYRRCCRARAEALLARWEDQPPLPGLSRGRPA